jgi:Ran GTPase-activating protein (RanGAP) involved in mRNA processing and transport
MTWLQLFAKLDFEEFLDIFPMINNFKYLYDYIHAVKDKISCLFLRIQYKRMLKSGYYFYMVILSEMTNVSSLILSDVENRLGSTYKYLIKGFSNFSQKGGKLKKLFLHQCYTSYLQGGIYKILKNMPDLESIQTYGSNLNDEAGKAIGKILSDNKSMKELDLSDTTYYDAVAKDIADGLMRAKLLESLKLRNNISLYNGISPMLYNLAFSPRIKHIDLTGCNIGGNASICEALYKLLKISGSLEHLILNNTNAASGMSPDFFMALGENKTLQSLHINTTTRYSSDFCSKLGKATAMNAKKNGSLETLACEQGFDTYNFENFIKSMYISEQDHEYWYGDKATADKMAGEDLERKIYCNLKHLNVKSSCIPYGGNIHEIKKRVNPNWPEMVKLFSTEISHVNLAKCGLIAKKDMDLISHCIENPIWKTHVSFLNLSGNKINKEGAKILCEVLKKQFTVTHLDLSGNKLGVSGCKAIAKALLNNTTLKYLNLYSNQMDVDGARCLKETLLVNDTLEYIDVGSNRLRDKGILAMAEGISGNKTCALKGISIRYNFVTDDGADKFFGIIIESSKVNKVFVKNNHLTEPYISSLEKTIKESKSNIYIDCLDKMKFLTQEKLDRSIWISPIGVSFTTQSLTQFFQDTHKCGLIKEVRIYHGNTINGKPSDNRYAMIEFAHENSVPRSLRIASKQLSTLNGTRFRIYKAGTANMGNTAPSAAKNPVTRHAGRGGRGTGGRGKPCRARGGRRGRR